MCTILVSMRVGDYLDNRYVIDRPIARGGMATVYRCVDTRLGREVAAKVMHEQYVHDPVFLDRFRREARAMAQLSHPNLVNVYDFSAQGDTIFLIMELITGGTLRELLAERGPMPPHAATSVLRGLLTGLGVAHAKGLVHRDIKPDNVLISADHQVKLADFGLVRAAAESPQSTDQIVGTVSYLSPEQVNGSAITPASDVYSAGIVLFELLTGRTPFTGDTPLAHAYARLQDDVPPPSQLIDGVPMLFDELVTTATARTPSERFRDAGEFLDALDDVARDLRLPAYTVPAPKNSAANRAAAHPTRFGSQPRPPHPPYPQRPNGAGSTRAVPQAERRLFPDAPGAGAAAAVPQPVPQPAPQPVPVPTRQAPVAPPPTQRPPTPAAPPAARGPRPKVRRVSNRSGLGIVVYVLFAVAVTAAVAVGGWWFGSGLYGEIPPLLSSALGG